MAVEKPRKSSQERADLTPLIPLLKGLKADLEAEKQAKDKKKEEALPGEDKTNKDESSDAEKQRLVYELVKIVTDDIKNGFRPLIVCGIPKEAMEEFEEKIKSRGQDLDTEIRNFIFETIGKPIKKERGFECLGKRDKIRDEQLHRAIEFFKEKERENEGKTEKA